MQMPRRWRLPLLLRMALGASAAAAPQGPAPALAPPADELEASLFLIGDAGEPDPKGEPVLAALGREAAADPLRSLVVFLGDNVYERGLPATDADDRAEAERRLMAQLEAVRGSGARGLLIPGNHDWAKHGKDGWDAIKRQARFVAERGGERIAFLPEGGCPGPSVLDVSEHLRLVVLDTQWLLHDGPKPLHPDSACSADSEPELEQALADALAGAGTRQVVVAAHHPLATGGPHGGHFTWKDHLFPLTRLKGWLWLPLPGVGSIYPLSRGAGISDQDLSGPRYRRMLELLERVFTRRPPLAYAAGHEHNLQVLRGRSARFLLVSGGGIYGHLSPVTVGEDTRFAQKASGFMRLDVTRSGAVRLGVRVVDQAGEAREPFSLWLE